MSFELYNIYYDFSYIFNIDTIILKNIKEQSCVPSKFHASSQYLPIDYKL